MFKKLWNKLFQVFRIIFNGGFLVIMIWADMIQEFSEWICKKLHIEE